MSPFRKNPLTYFLSAFVFFLVNCSKDNNITRSYYYWRNSYYITSGEHDFIKANNIQKIYKKILDIDWNETMGAFPVSSSNLSSLDHDLNFQDSLQVNIVPVIFITNKTFVNLTKQEITQLALRIMRRCVPGYDSADMAYEGRHQSYYSKRIKTKLPTEIQFDCDWTNTTKDNYFFFLTKFRSLLPSKSIEISATIRLHQYKYIEKTGVPPADRGMLMVYNISDLTKKSTSNSIFDYAKAKEYFTSSKPYPLPLDIALPAYSWSIIFRDGKFYQIENNLAEDELKTYSFLEQASAHYYKVKKDTVFRDIFLRNGDEIKAETIDANTLKKAALLSQEAINAQSFSVSLFELSADEIKHYDHETLESIYNSYR